MVYFNFYNYAVYIYLNSFVAPYVLNRNFKMLLFIAGFKLRYFYLYSKNKPQFNKSLILALWGLESFLCFFMRQIIVLSRSKLLSFFRILTTSSITFSKSSLFKTYSNSLSPFIL